MKSLEERIGYFIIQVFFIAWTIVGMVMITKGLMEVKLAYESNKWNNTEGQIAHSDIKISQDSDGNKTNYQPVVKFDYKVVGKSLQGDRVVFGTVVSVDYNASLRIVQKYPRGKQIPVFYDPDNPHNSVLEAGLTKKSFIKVTGGFFLFTLCAGFVILFWTLS